MFNADKEKSSVFNLRLHFLKDCTEVNFGVDDRGF